MAATHDDKTEPLFDRIRRAREHSGMSIDEAAGALGVSRVQVWRLEHKSTTVSAERLFELADLYGVDPRRLLQGDGADIGTGPLLDVIGDVVQMVEEIVQTQEARPAPLLIRQAVAEILKQELQSSRTADTPFDPGKYQGLVTLLFKTSP